MATATLDNDEVLDRLSERLLASLNKGGFRQEALQPGLLDMMIQIVMDLLSDCFAGSSPEQIAERAKANGRGVQLMVRRAVVTHLRDEQGFGAFRRNSGDRLVAAIVSAAAAGSVADYTQLATVRWQ